MKNIKEYNNIKDMMTDIASQRGEKIVFTNKIKEDKTVKYEEITYTRLLEDINSLGTSLYENGFENSRIAIAGRNRYEWIVAHLANLMGGIVSVPLDKELKIEEFENSLIRSKAKAIIFDEKYVEMIEEIKNRNNTEIKE